MSEYIGMDIPVNLAARLESAATPGYTHVEETTAQFIRHQFELRPAGPISLIGFPEPLLAFALGQELDETLPLLGQSDLHSPLVGRD